MPIYLASKELIQKRNDYLEKLFPTMFRFVSQLVNKRSFLFSRDFSVDREDAEQEVYISLVSTWDKMYLQSKDLSRFEDPKWRTVTIVNSLQDFARKLEAKKRGGAREKVSEVQIVYIDSLPEEVLSSFQNEDGILEDVINFISEVKAEEVGLSEEELDIFIGYFVLGFTMEEISDRLELSGRVAVSRSLKKSTETIAPFIRANLENIYERNTY